jgi:hypothetical protein
LGYSLVSKSVELARLVKVKSVAVYCHVPEQTSHELNTLQAQINKMA